MDTTPAAIPARTTDHRDRTTPLPLTPTSATSATAGYSFTTTAAPMRTPTATVRHPRPARPPAVITSAPSSSTMPRPSTWALLTISSTGAGDSAYNAAHRRSLRTGRVR